MKYGFLFAFILATENTFYTILFSQPIEDLRLLLQDFQYLSSARGNPPTQYKPSSAPPDDLGISGEYAAQLIHARQQDIVHYLPPLKISDTTKAQNLSARMNHDWHPGSSSFASSRGWRIC